MQNKKSYKIPLFINSYELLTNLKKKSKIKSRLAACECESEWKERKTEFIFFFSIESYNDDARIV